MRTLPGNFARRLGASGTSADGDAGVRVRTCMLLYPVLAAVAVVGRAASVALPRLQSCNSTCARKLPGRGCSNLKTFKLFSF
jgi:hypothetical protein